MIMKRNVELDVVRCGMNYMIVLLHAWAAFQYVPWGCGEFLVWTAVCSHLAWLAIPTFFMISGYLLFQKFSFSSLPEKMNRRVRRLLVPYLTWNVFFVLFYLSLAHLVPRLGARVVSYGLTTFSGALGKVIGLTEHPIDGPLWFLRTLLIFGLLSPILWWLMRWRRGLLALGLCLVWCVGEVLLGWSAALGKVVPAYSLVCFVLGGVVAMNGKDIVVFFRRGWWIWVGLIACAARAWLAIPRQVNQTSWPLWASVLMSLLAIAEAPALIALVARLPVERIGQSRSYAFLREMSFFAYAGHFLFCSMWLHVVAPLLGGYWPGKFTVLILIFVGCGVPTMAVVYLIAKRFCPKALKLFDGTL